MAHDYEEEDLKRGCGWQIQNNSAITPSPLSVKEECVRGTRALVCLFLLFKLKLIAMATSWLYIVGGMTAATSFLAWCLSRRIVRRYTFKFGDKVGKYNYTELRMGII